MESFDPPTAAGAPGRHETETQRADRRWNDILQEVRVAQTGAQILFGFLLSVAFTPRFAGLGGFDRDLYVATVVLGALATGTLIAPVAFHRLLAGHLLKPQLVVAAGRLISCGIVLLALTVCCSLLLLLRVAAGPEVAWWLTAAVMLWFVGVWLVLPALLLHRDERRRREES